METQNCHRCAARGHISLIPVYYLPRLRSSNTGRVNESKQLYAGKAKKQEIPCTNDYRQHWWRNTSGKYTCPGRIPAAYSLEWAAGSKGLHVNTDKTEFMCFNQRGDIFTLNGRWLKLVDKFTYLRSTISSTENDINMRLAKAWIAIDRLLVIWKSDLQKSTEQQ